MAKKQITTRCLLDTDELKITNTDTLENVSLGASLTDLAGYLVDHPNRPFSTEHLGRMLLVEEGTIDKYMQRIKNCVNSVMGFSDAKDLFRRKNGKWMYVVPRDVLEASPIAPERKRFFIEKRYIPENLPRLMERYESRRDIENTVINRFLINGETMIFLTGEAGLGKSEAAIAIGRKLMSGARVARIIYEGSLYDSIMKLYPEITGPREDVIFEKKLAALLDAYDGGFLIIDNFYDPEKSFAAMRRDRVFRRLIGSSVRFLFVTRYRNMGSFGFVEMVPLPLEGQIRVMRDGDLEQFTDRQLARLCRLAGGNTLLCDLIGKLLRNTFSDLSYDDILRILSDARLSESSVRVDTEKDRTYDEKTIYAHLKALCDGLSLTDDEKKALKALSLLPLEGMDKNDFMTLSGTDPSTLTDIYNRGLAGANSDGKVVLHTLYSLYYRDPDTAGDIAGADISLFLENLFDYYNNGDLSDTGKCAVITSVLSNAYDSMPAGRKKARVGLFLAGYAALTGRYNDAYKIEKESAGMAEDDTALLARLYKDLAISAGRLGKDREAVGRLEKSVELLKEEKMGVTLLQRINSLAYAYGKSGDHEKQCALIRQTLDERDLSGYEVNKARMLNDLADGLLALGRPDEAERNIDEAMDLYSKLGGIHPVWTIQAERLKAMITAHRGKRKEAARMLSRLFEESGKKLGEYHLETVRICSMAGDLTEDEEAAHWYSQSVKRALHNDMARERLWCSKTDGGYEIGYLSEGNTLFVYRMRDDPGLEERPMPEAGPVRTVTYRE